MNFDHQCHIYSFVLNEQTMNNHQTNKQFEHKFMMTMTKSDSFSFFFYFILESFIQSIHLKMVNVVDSVIMMIKDTQQKKRRIIIRKKWQLFQCIHSFIFDEMTRQREYRLKHTFFHFQINFFPSVFFHFVLFCFISKCTDLRFKLETTIPEKNSTKYFNQN